ncbi:MAG: hypothetical protein NTV22_06255 [bacterium]|nr:hypothetical protein [bacterium]
MNKTLAISTVAGLIGLAATAPAAIVVSPITNQPLADAVNNLDIDADGTVDFTVNYANANYDLAGQSESNLVAADAALVRVYSFKESIAFADPTEPTISIANLIGVGNSYVGVKFLHADQPCAAWLQFSYPTAEPTEGLLVSAAWQGISGDSIQAGDVPEPATGAGACLSAAALLIQARRRRTRHAASPS